MSDDRHVTPDVTRTYALSGWEKAKAVLGAALPIVVAVGLGVLVASGPALPPAESVILPLVIVLLVFVGVAYIGTALRIPRSAVQLSPEGLTPAPGTGGSPIPWQSICGARRSEWRFHTTLTDASGAAVAVVDDRLDDAHGCLEGIADAAALERPALPAHYALRGVPISFVLFGAVVAAVVALLAFGKMDVLALIMSLVMLAVFGFISTFEAISLEVEESGITLRRALGVETFRWDEITRCGFRLLSMRDSRWVEATLETARGTRKLVPIGAPALLIVAAIRERLRPQRHPA